MSGYDSSTKRRRTTDDDYSPYQTVQPTTARAQANARQQQQRLAQQQQQHAQQQQQLQQQQQYYYHDQPPHPKQPVPVVGQTRVLTSPAPPQFSLASLPPTALQRYLSRYGLLPPTSSLSYRHAVFPVPSLPSSLPPPLDRDTRTLNLRTAKLSYVPAVRNARIRGAREAVGVRVEDEEEEEEERGEERGEEVGKGKGEGEGNKAGEKAPERGTVKSLKRPWTEPRLPEFGGLTAFDPPEKVVERLAVRATAHWEKRDSIKEAETLTNFMFSCRSRGHTLRATPQG
ncbi:hypothetical protein JCM11251_006384 [Rhodosporidiobolus azoricus]